MRGETQEENRGAKELAICLPVVAAGTRQDAADIARPLAELATADPSLEPSLVERLLDLLRADRSAGCGRALELLAERLAAREALLVRWDLQDPVVLAAWRAEGSLAKLGLVLSASRREMIPAASSFQVSTSGGDGSSWAIVGRRCETAWLIVSFGLGGSPPPALWPLARILLQLIAEARAETPVASEDPRATELALKLPPSYIVGRSAAAAELCSELGAAAQSSAPVLVSGETGVGKELVSRIIHDSSARSGGPFVAINCAAIPAELLEAELFGVRRGVATGVDQRDGLVQRAHGGTLLLDEIGEMPPALQAKILRVLQERVVQPLGGRPAAVDARIVAATNADLQRRIETGSFRADLFYRIAGLLVRVPPLRERREDIPLFVEHFLRAAVRDMNRPVAGMTAAALSALQAHAWPGNLRELAFELLRAVGRCRPGEAVDVSVLSPELFAASVDRLGETAPPYASLRFADHLPRLEARLIRAALRRTRWNRRQAARLLGLSRSGLAQKMKRLAIEP